MRRLSLVISVLALAPVVGCFGAGDGISVPADRIYFPVGLAVDADAQHLVVASSDFDLQYNSGTVQSYDLARLRGAIPTPCNADADCQERCSALAATDCEERPFCDVDARSNAGSHVCVADRDAPEPCAGFGTSSQSNQLLHPGRCRYIDPRRPADGGPAMLIDSVKVSAFATDILIRARPAGTAGAPFRMFVPVRGDATLHWIDLDDAGALHCGQDRNAGACDDAHRAGDDPERENEDDVTLGPEPYALDALEDGSAIVVTNQTTGAAALFVNDWDELGPTMKFQLSSSRIPARPVGIAAVPRARGDQSTPAFLVAFRNSPQVRVFRYQNDLGAAATDPGAAEFEPSHGARPYLVDAGGVAIDANSVGTDSRGIAIDDSRRRAKTTACGDDAACLASAALESVDVFVANRSPATLLVGRASPPGWGPRFSDTVPLAFGASRVVVSKIKNAEGELETRVFAICFDARRIFVYDPARGRIESEILTGRGPHAIAVDTEHALMYVGHFTDSYLGVVSLDQRFPATYATMIASVGKPSAPRASK